MSDPTPSRWELEIHADRRQFERMAPDGIEFPFAEPTRRVPLVGDELTIGRGTRHDDVRPDIDLSGDGEDPGVSRFHAVLRRLDGGWQIEDVGSMNGTTLNDGAATLTPGVASSLVDGDRIHLGAWTTLVLRAVEEAVDG